MILGGNEVEERGKGDESPRKFDEFPAFHVHMTIGKMVWVLYKRCASYLNDFILVNGIK